MPNRRTDAGLPRSLIIGPYRYEVRVDDAAIVAYVNATGQTVTAFADLDGHKIVLSSGEYREVSLIHEILHVLADQSGLDGRLGSERMEDTIQSLDNGIVGALRANPALLEYICR